MTATPITDELGEKLIELIRVAREEVPTLGAVSAADSSIAGLLAESLGEILSGFQRLEEGINNVSESIPDVAVAAVAKRNRGLSA